MAKLAVDPATGEIIQTAVMVKADKAPAIVLDNSSQAANKQRRNLQTTGDL